MLAYRDTALRAIVAGPSIDQDVHTNCRPTLTTTASTPGVAHDEADELADPHQQGPLRPVHAASLAPALQPSAPDS